MASDADLLAGLVAWWPLTEASGTREDSVGALDLTDSGATGTVNFQPNIQPTITLGKAAVFTGTTALSVASTTALQIVGTGELSLACWARTDTLPTFQQTIAGKYSTTNGLEYALVQLNATQFWWAVGNGQAGIGSSSVISSTTVTDVDVQTRPATGKWFHLVGVYAPPLPSGIDLGQMQFYINGVLVSFGLINRSVGTPTGGTSQFGVGARVAAAGTLTFPFTGAVCGVGLWNRALSAGDVGTLYNGGKGLQYDFSYPDA